jgi:phenylalanyl-tRNA synthetase beta chain
VLAPLATPAGDVVAAATTAAREACGTVFALEDVRLFDDYRGTGLPEGHKSLAVRLKFRAADRTLTDDDVNSVFQDAIRRLESSTPWRVRR